MEEARAFEDVGLLTELVATQEAILKSDFELGTVLDEIVAQARRLTRADAAVIEMLDGEELEYRAVAGGATRFLGMRMSVSKSLSGRTIRDGEILWSQDAGEDSRFDVETATANGARSLIVVPLMHRTRAVGALKVYASKPLAFAEKDVRVMQMLAGNIGGAIARAELLDRLARSSSTDALTGLPNRRSWDERAPRELARTSRSGGPLSLALLDLDHFRAFNEAHGRAAGDTLLKTCAARWWSCLRSVDLLARLGGEEFAVLLPGCIAPDAVGVMDRLRTTTRELRTVSAGVAQWDMQEPLESLMLRADVALYKAKKMGRDRVELAEAPDDVEPVDRSPAPLDI